jgi:hypothetical protein
MRTGDKATGMWSWPLASNQCWGKEAQGKLEDDTSRRISSWSAHEYISCVVLNRAQIFAGSPGQCLWTHGRTSYTPSWGYCSNTVKTLDSFPAFYGAWRFITDFTRALYWSLSWARPIQSTPPHTISPGSFLILSIHLRLGLASGLFPSGFAPNNLYAVTLLPHSCYMSRPSDLSLFAYSNYTLLSSITDVNKHKIPNAARKRTLAVES